MLYLHNKQQQEHCIELTLPFSLKTTTKTSQSKVGGLQSPKNGIFY